MNVQLSTNYKPQLNINYTNSLHLHKTYAISGAAQASWYLNAYVKQQKVLVGSLHLTNPIVHAQQTKIVKS